MKFEGRSAKLEWNSVPLSEFAESVDYGVTASATEHPVGPKFLRITDIQNGEVNWDSVPWCECDPGSARDARLQPGDIVFARTGATTGKSYLIGECPSDSVFASYLIRVRVGHLAEPSFISHFFQSPLYWAQITKAARGAAQLGVNATTLKALKIPLPPLAEQRRIAGILDKAKELRNKRRAALAELDTLPQSIFIDLFGNPTTNPKAWPIKRLDQLCRGITDIDHKMPKGIDEGFAFISAKDLTDDGRISFENVKRISEEDFRRLARKSRPEKGDIIYSRIGVNLGKARMVVVDFPFLASYSCCTIKPNRDFVDARYLCSLLDSPFMLRQAHKGVRAIAVPDLGIGEIKAFKVIVPPLSRQREFARTVTAVEKIKAAQHTSLAEIDKLFASLQYRAFRGEL